MTMAFDMERVNIAALETILAIDNLCVHDIPDEARRIVERLRDVCAECAAGLDPFLRGQEAGE
jgi:hypothetical protein